MNGSFAALIPGIDDFLGNLLMAASSKARGRRLS
jgi:hypothetical protein